MTSARSSPITRCNGATGTGRVELNAMTPQFIEWLDRKMAEHGEGKLIPPTDVILQEFDKQLETEMRKAVTERILREAGLEERLAAALEAVKRPKGRDLLAGIKAMFAETPEHEWRDHIKSLVTMLLA